MKKEPLNSSEFRQTPDGEIEYELGVPIPGLILPKSEWVQTAIKRLPPPSPIDWSQVFGRTSPIVLDIGCGNGRFAISSAVRRPSMDHVAIDLLPVVIRYATRRGNQRGLSNLRFAVCDGFQFLKNFIASGSVSEIHVYHPQPYKDVREQHLRLFSASFVELLYQSLIVGGQLFLQSDNRSYWEIIRQAVSPRFLWEERKEPWQEDPYGRSRREFISNQKKLPIFRAVATRRDD